MSELAGRWHDGHSSRVRAVRLRLEDGDTLRLVDDDGRESDWPLAEIRINPRLGNTPRVLRREGHGQVECADSPLLAQWFPQPPGRIEAWADWLERRRAAIAIAAVAIVLAVVAFFRLGVPWAAVVIAERMPATVEAEVSRQAVALLSRVHLRPSRLSAARREILRKRFRALVAGEPRHAQMRLAFAHAPLIGPNAFALPDGRIHLTDALVELAGDDDEVLAVLAHEAGHHVHRHGMRQAIESSSVLLVEGLMFGDASGSSLAVSIPAVLLTSGFSRGHEREADGYAFGLLRKRGMSPRAFARIMRRLSAHVPEAVERGPMGYLSTHPPSPERISAAERAGSGDDPD